MNDRKALVLIIVQAATLLALGAVIVVLMLQHGEMKDETDKVVSELRSVREARYEYKIVPVFADGGERRGEEAMKFAAVTPNEADLTGLGSSGWEVVASYLEIETAWPNFGNSDYVTGLQPNIRPQRLVLILRRRVA